MTEYARRYLSAGAPETIMHGEYEGTLVDIQPLVDGLVCGIYRFPGGDCIGGGRRSTALNCGVRRATMTRREEIDLEIRRQALRLYPRCTALFELPLMVYTQIMEDNTTRRKPYRVSEKRIKDIIGTMPEFQ